MNIFALHESPELAGQYHCDRHVIKMIVEYMQLLSTTHRVLDGKVCTLEFTIDDKLKQKEIQILPGEVPIIENNKIVIQNSLCYKATHANHPSAIWARSTNENYIWLLTLLRSCLSEYTFRYEKIHACEAKLNLLQNTPQNIPIGVRTSFAVTMPPEYQIQNDPISSYRNFYARSKSRFTVWTKRDVPLWFKEEFGEEYDASRFHRASKLGSSKNRSSKRNDGRIAR